MIEGLIDTHAHLTSAELAADVPGVLERARAAGVGAVVTIGTDIRDSRAAVALASRHDEVFASVGIHPHEAAKVAAGDYETLKELAAMPRVVAIGEIGLDYHYDFADRAAQLTVFERQLAMAAALVLPLVIHCREAVADVVSTLRRAGFTGRKAVFHCFTGTSDEAMLIADHGWRISFTGVVTYRRSVELQAIARDYPIDQLMIETDAPYLSPEPVRGARPNQPAHLRYTAEFVAALRGTSLGEITHHTARNAVEFFQLTT